MQFQINFKYSILIIFLIFSNSVFTFQEIDSLNLEIEETELITEDSSDSILIDNESNLESENYITLTPFLNLKSSQVRKGINLTNGNPSLAIGNDFSSSFGLNSSLEYNSELNNGLNFLFTSISIGYEYEFNDYLTSEITYQKTFYSKDDINPLSTATNNLSFNFDVVLPNFIADVSYSYYFGTSSINDIGLTLISYFKLGDKFKITPSLSSNISTYKIVFKKITRIKENFGISNLSTSLKFSYEIFENFNISLTPSILYTPNKDLSIKKIQGYLGLNFDYDLDINY